MSALYVHKYLGARGKYVYAIVFGHSIGLYRFWFLGWLVGLLAWLGSLIYERRTDDTAEWLGYVYILELDYVNDSDHNL